MADNTYERLFPQGSKKSANPWETPPTGFLPIDRNRALILPPVSGETLLEDIILNGSNYEGWIRYAGIVLVNPGPQRFFTIKQNLQPIRDYVSVQVPLGQPDLMGPIYLRLQSNVTLGFYATNNSAVALPIRYRIFGWYYPVSEGRK